jgi:hypothetical protein
MVEGRAPWETGRHGGGEGTLGDGETWWRGGHLGSLLAEAQEGGLEAAHGPVRERPVHRH